MPKLVDVPMHLIDEPEIAMRVEIPDDYLRSLAENIAANGLINPVSVERNGDRYTLGAGHCRYLAHKLLGRETIPANDFTGDGVNLEAIKVSENLCRHDISDAEMAVYMQELIDKHQYNLEQLMDITKRSEAWIATRLSLFRGDREVFDAMAAGKIKLSAAVVLNKFPDQFRHQYLHICIDSTPPARVIEGWLTDLIKMGLPQQDLAVTDGAPAATELAPGVVLNTCWVCLSDSLGWTMKFDPIHQHCKEMIERQLHEASK